MKNLTWGKRYYTPRTKKSFAYQVPKPTPLKSMRKEEEQTAEGEKQEYFVRGERASEPEYFASKALEHMEENNEILKWTWQPSYITFHNIPGEIRLDVMIDIPPRLPVQIDGRWHFKSAGQQQHDLIQDARLNDRLRRDGAMPVCRIPADPWLKTEEMALETLRRAIMGETFVKVL